MPKLLLPQRTTFVDAYLSRYAKSLCLPTITSGNPTLPWTLVRASAVATAAASSFARVMAEFGFGRTLMTAFHFDDPQPPFSRCTCCSRCRPACTQGKVNQVREHRMCLPVRGYPFARRPLHPDAIACASGSGEPASASALLRNLSSFRYHKATCIIGEKKTREDGTHPCRGRTPPIETREARHPRPAVRRSLCVLRPCPAGFVMRRREHVNAANACVYAYTSVGSVASTLDSSCLSSARKKQPRHVWHSSSSALL
jgi:hypothetical protein